MNLCIVGAGYVGLVAAACFASRGHKVVCVEKDVDRVEGLINGDLPFYEPKLNELVETSLPTGNLTFTSNLTDALNDSDVVFLAVGTPMASDGAADVGYLLDAVGSIAFLARRNLLIVNKSTSPPGTIDLLKNRVEEIGTSEGVALSFESNPEFLKEGSAVADFLNPDRIVIGFDNHKDGETLKNLYRPFNRRDDRIFSTDIRSAELIKYAANSMLACRISFMNEIAQLADKIGANINDVRLGVGGDSRIGRSFLYSGIGYGGSCFPKDVRALRHVAENNGISGGLIAEIDQANERQKEYASTKALEYLRGLKDSTRKKVAIWGIAFKPDTSDIRESAVIDVIEALTESGFMVTVFDPKARSEGEHYFQGNSDVEFSDSAYECTNDASLLIVATEWSVFLEPNYKDLESRMYNAAIFDCKNIYSREIVIKNRIDYLSIGNNV